MYSISIERDGRVLAAAQGENEAALLYRGAYEPGDAIVFASSTQHVCVQVDQAVAPARVYLPQGRFVYRPPLEGDGLAVYPPQAFRGEMHLLSIVPQADDAYRNLAPTPRISAACHGLSARDGQRGDAQRECVCRAQCDRRQHIACGHGEWPFGSWGIGARTDAELTLDFGREVEIDAMILYLRADFPHDAYWVQGTVTLDDGFEKTFPLEGRDGPQRIELGEHRVRSLRLHSLVKCDMPSAFPALRQIEVYGHDL